MCQVQKMWTHGVLWPMWVSIYCAMRVIRNIFRTWSCGKSLLITTYCGVILKASWIHNWRFQTNILGNYIVSYIFIIVACRTILNQLAYHISFGNMAPIKLYLRGGGGTVVQSPNFDIKFARFPKCQHTWMIYHLEALGPYFWKMVFISGWLPW